MSKTGGTTGTNQYQVRGSSRAKTQPEAPKVDLVGMITRSPDTIRAAWAARQEMYQEMAAEKRRDVDVFLWRQDDLPIDLRMILHRRSGFSCDKILDHPDCTQQHLTELLTRHRGDPSVERQVRSHPLYSAQVEQVADERIQKRSATAAGKWKELNQELFELRLWSMQIDDHDLALRAAQCGPTNKVLDLLNYLKRHPNDDAVRAAWDRGQAGKKTEIRNHILADRRLSDALDTDRLMAARQLQLDDQQYVHVVTSPQMPPHVAQLMKLQRPTAPAYEQLVVRERSKA